MLFEETNLLTLQAQILKDITHDKPLESTLHDIVGMLEGMAPDTKGIVLVLRRAGNAVLSVHDTGISEQLREQLKSFPLQEASHGPFAWVRDHASRMEPTLIASDPRWKDTPWGREALSAGFHEAMAIPITGSSDQVLGVLGLLSWKSEPEPVPPAALEVVASLTSTAITKYWSNVSLQESEEQMRLAAEGAHLGTWEWNLASGRIHWSEIYQKLPNPPNQADLAFDSIIASLHPEDRERVIDAIKRALDLGEKFSEEFRTVTAGGSSRWITCTGRGYSDDDTSPPSFMRGIAMDITSKKEAEQMAMEDAERFRFLAEFLPEKIFTASPDGEISYLNKQWAIYTGLPLEEVATRGWRDFVHPEDIEEKSARWSHAMETGEPFEFEHRFQRADGTYRWHLSRARPMRNGDGTIRIWIGSNTDVDDLKRTQFALRESESRSRLAMESAGMGFWDWDIKQGTIKCSPDHNRILGLDPDIEELPYEKVMSTVHPDDRSAIEYAMHQTTKQHLDYESEFRILISGNVRWVASHGRAYNNEATGQAERMIGVVRDITLRKQNELRLRNHQQEMQATLAAAELARDEAENAGRAKDQFLAVLSHELRTPLTPVLMAVSSIGRDPQLPNHVREAMQMIQRNIRTEARLIEDLLDLTRITRNKMELRMEPVDIHQALRQAIEICESDIDPTKHHIEQDLQAEKPMVRGDSERLQQVFWNLIKNAVKFTPRGGTIRISSRQEENRIRVKISDTGMGIAADVLPKIFNPFEQGAHASAKQLGGLGLGLAICQATIQAHQGALTALSDGENLGATFIVELDKITPDTQ